MQWKGVAELCCVLILLTLRFHSHHFFYSIFWSIEESSAEWKKLLFCSAALVSLMFLCCPWTRFKVLFVRPWIHFTNSSHWTKSKRDFIFTPIRQIIFLCRVECSSAHQRTHAPSSNFEAWSSEKGKLNQCKDEIKSAKQKKRKNCFSTPTSNLFPLSSFFVGVTFFQVIPSRRFSLLAIALLIKITPHTPARWLLMLFTALRHSKVMKSNWKRRKNVNGGKNELQGKTCAVLLLF